MTLIIKFDLGIKEKNKTKTFTSKYKDLLTLHLVLRTSTKVNRLENQLFCKRREERGHTADSMVGGHTDKYRELLLPRAETHKGFSAWYIMSS